MKWFTCHNHFLKMDYFFYCLPQLAFWYKSDYFLETGVYTPAMGIEIGWLKWKYALAFQQGY